MRTKLLFYIFAMLVSVLFSCNKNIKTENVDQSNKSQIIEYAPFVIKDSVSIEILLKSANDLQVNFLQKQVGFIKRELVKKSDNEFVDIVYWKSKEDAEKAGKNAANSPFCFSYFQLMKDAEHSKIDVNVSHFEIIQDYYK